MAGATLLDMDGISEYLNIQTAFYILLPLVLLIHGYLYLSKSFSDVHELTLTSQSSISNSRVKGETAVYRNHETAHGLPLLSGLQLKYGYRLRDGNVKDVWKLCQTTSCSIQFIDDGFVSEPISTLKFSTLFSALTRKFAMTKAGHVVEAEKNPVMAVWIDPTSFLQIEVFSLTASALLENITVRLIDSPLKDGINALQGASLLVIDSEIYHEIKDEIPVDIRVVILYPANRDSKAARKRGNSLDLSKEETPVPTDDESESEPENFLGFGEEGILQVTNICDLAFGTKTDTYNTPMYGFVVDNQLSHLRDTVYDYQYTEDDFNTPFEVANTVNGSQIVSFNDTNLMSAVAGLLKAIPEQHKWASTDTVMVVGDLTDVNVWVKIFAVLVSNASLVLVPPREFSFALIEQVNATVLCVERDILRGVLMEIENLSIWGRLKFNHYLSLLSHGVFPIKGSGSIAPHFEKVRMIITPHTAKYTVKVKGPEHAASLLTTSTLELTKIRALTGARIISSLELSPDHCILGPVLQTNIYDYRVIDNHSGKSRLSKTGAYEMEGVISPNLECKAVNFGEFSVENPEARIGKLLVRGWAVGSVKRGDTSREPEWKKGVTASNRDWQDTGLVVTFGPDGCVYRVR